nr:MFS transporter [Thermocrispum municipale]
MLRPVLSSLLARLPVAMVGFSVLLYVQRATGSFATAGLVGAGSLIGVAVGSVLQGRIIDRLGPMWPLLVAAALFGMAITGLVLSVENGAPTVTMMALAILSGLSQPQVASSSRSLWTRVLPSGPLREAAYAYEAISMEVFFIIGPGFAGVMIALPWPGLGVVIGAAMMVVGSVIFALSRVVRAWGPTTNRERRRLLGALVSPGMRTVVIAAAGFGIVIGFVEVAVPAAATAVGRPTLGGLLLSVWSLSSVLFGVAYSLRPIPRSIELRLPVLLGAFAICVGLVALPTSLAPESMPALGLSMILAGILITPQSTTHSSVIELVAPRGTATEAFGWIVTAVTLGLSAGHSLSGQIVEAYGPPWSFLAALTVGTVLATVVFLRRKTMSATPPEVVELSPDTGLGRTPQNGVDIGVDQLDDLSRSGVRA